MLSLSAGAPTSPTTPAPPPAFSEMEVALKPCEPEKTLTKCLTVPLIGTVLKVLFVACMQG